MHRTFFYDLLILKQGCLFILTRKISLYSRLHHIQVQFAKILQ